MFSNIGGMEIVFLMIVALIVLGPSKLPEAARQVGSWVTEIRRISAGFQREFREAIQEPVIEAEARARGAVERTKRTVADPFLHPDGGPSSRTADPTPSDDAGPGSDAGRASDD